MKQDKEWEITYRDGSIIWDGYYVTAKSLKKAVKKARQRLYDDAYKHANWSVYRVAELDKPETEKFGPFRYKKGWGKP